MNAREVMRRQNLRIWSAITVAGMAGATVVILTGVQSGSPASLRLLLFIGLLSFPPNLLQFYCQSISRATRTSSGSTR